MKTRWDIITCDLNADDLIATWQSQTEIGFGHRWQGMVCCGVEIWPFTDQAWIVVGKYS